MFTKLISKGSSLVLQIIAVVVGVLVFAFFDPFGILSPTKLTLKDTPVQVHSMQEMGELITAEYYGEVIGSLNGVREEDKQKLINAFDSTIEVCHDDFDDAYSTMVAVGATEKFKNKGELYTYYRKQFPNLISNPLYGVYMNYLFYALENKGNVSKFKLKSTNKSLSEADEKLLLKRLYKNKKDYPESFLKVELQTLKSKYKAIVEKSDQKQYKKKARIAMIGRGWVKVGYDFSKLDDNNFKYHSGSKRIYLVGLDHTVSANINPWFIPEQGVAGFEFLIVDKSVRFQRDLTRKVKQRCLDKLMAQALDKDIETHARKNAETYLKSFFSLVMQEELEGVHILENDLDYTLEMLLLDSVIRNDEIFAIDSALLDFNRKYSEPDKWERMAGFLDTIGKSRQEIMGEKITWNARSAQLFMMLEDQRIDSADVLKFPRFQNVRVLDLLWHSKFINKYVGETEIADSTLLEELKKDKGGFMKKIVGQDEDQFCSQLQRLMLQLDIEIDTNVTIYPEKVIELQRNPCIEFRGLRNQFLEDRANKPPKKNATNAAPAAATNKSAS